MAEPGSRETKFGYGFLLVGAGLPYLIDKLFGAVPALIAAALILVTGIGFLIAGHLDKEKNGSRHRRGIMETIAMCALIGASSGALIGSITGAIWKVSRLGSIAEQKEESHSGTPPPLEGASVPPLGVSSESASPLSSNTILVSPIEKLSDLGWAVQQKPNEIQFEIANKPLPDMKQSATYFKQLSKSFRLQLQGLSSINGLKYLAGTDCTAIEIGAGEFTDVSDLSELKSLRRLGISQTPMTGTGFIDISPLLSLINLRELNLFAVRVNDIAALRGLKNLVTINLKGTFVRDLSPLSNLHFLETIDVTDAPVSDLSPLNKSTMLREIGISAKQIPSLPSLVDLKNLRAIRIIDQATIDLSGISSLVGIEDLWIWGSSSPLNLTPLHQLKQLRKLSVTGLGFGQLTPVTGIDVLMEFNKLRQLSLGSISISDIRFVSGLKNLTQLDLGMMPVSSVEALRGLILLTSVSLNSMSVVDISPLLELPALRKVSVIRTPARADVLTELERRGVTVQR